MIFDYSLIRDPQTRLDRYLETKDGESISAESLSILFAGDITEAEYQLRRWEARHPRDCFEIRSSPILVRVSMNSRRRNQR